MRAEQREKDRRLKAALSKKPFFVMGPPKSGTTWIQRQLDAHREIVCAGEGHFADFVAPKIMELVQEYNRLLDASADEVYGGTRCYPPLDMDDIRDLSMRMIGLQFAQLDLPKGTKWIGDKSPATSVAWHVLLDLFPEARFVIIVRDGRDATLSRVAHNQRLGAARPTVDTLQGWDLDSKLEKCAEDWSTYVAGVHSFETQHPNRAHRVSYESLLDDPMTTLSSVFSFLGVDSSPTSTAACVNATSFEALSGRAPGERDDSSFIRRGTSGNWRDEMTAEQIGRFEAIAGRWLATYGYPVVASHPRSAAT